MTIAGYMQTRVVTVRPDDTIKDAILLMLKKKTNGTVVVDANNRVVGILSSWDIIKHIVPDYLEGDSNLALFEDAGVFSRRIKEVQNDTVSLVMTSQVRTAKKTDSLIEALTLLAKFHIRQLPIVDEDNRLVGYINRTDIKRAVGDVLAKK